MILVKTLIVLLTILMLYHFYYTFIKPKQIEGLTNLTYKDPGLDKDPTYLSIVNAANIAFLKSQIDDLTGIKQTVQDLSTKTEQNTQAISDLGQSLKNTSQQLTGRDPNSTEPIPQASGLNYGNDEISV